MKLKLRKQNFTPNFRQERKKEDKKENIGASQILIAHKLIHNNWLHNTFKS